LGLLTVAAAVKDHDVLVWDTKGEYDLHPNTPPLAAMLSNLMHSFQPQVVGTTVITSEMNAGMDIFREVKRIDPSVVTVAGGLHATLCPADFKHTDTDIVCPGESAYTFREVIQALEMEKPLDSVKNIFFRKEGELIYSGLPEKVPDLAGKDFLMPDRSHLQRWIETYKVGKSPFPSTYVFTSLGCPYKCTFCSIWGQFKGKFHQREMESLIEELKQIDEYPVVRFSDANTIVDIPFISTLFDRIMQEGIHKTFVMDIRADTAVKYPWLIEKLARGGLKVVICGFESFRDEELKKYRKQSKAARIHEAIRIFEENGIMIRGNYVVPADYGYHDFEALAEYAGKHRVVYAGYTILTPMPGTKFFQEVKEEIIDLDYDKYNFFNCVMKTRLSLEEFYRSVGKLWLIKKGDDVI